MYCKACSVLLSAHKEEDKQVCLQVIEVIFIYIRLWSVKGCHSKGALITIQTQLTGSVGREGGFGEISNCTIYTQNILDRSQKPDAIHSYYCLLR